MRFGTGPVGETVEKVTICAGSLSASVLTWGAILQDVRLDGVAHGLTLGSDDLADYLGPMAHHGALIGPIANRISTARIKLGGMMYELERNQDGRIHLHSGKAATHRRLWQLNDQSDSHVTLGCTLPDGACGLPGNRRITVTYRVTAPASLTMKVVATTDDTTAMNIANHSFWNLDGTDTWAGHRLSIAADHYLPTNADTVPTGQIAPVAGTSMDFRSPQTITPDSHAFDTNFCLSQQQQDCRDVLTLTGQNGLCMTVATTEPGLQIYDNRGGIRPGRQACEGLAIEAQAWPDAPNHRGFPSIQLRPDETYLQSTSWRFG